MNTAVRYTRPTDLDEALRALAADPEARPITGGTDLMVQMRLGRRQVGLAVDTAGIPELNVVEVGDPTRLGAAVTLRTFLNDAGLCERFPALQQAANLLGGRQVQAVASFGGNICNASPAAETSTPLLVHDAVAVIAGAAGLREVPLTEFFTGPGRTVVGGDELLVELRLPQAQGDQRSAYRRLELRRSVDIAIVSASARVQVVDGAIAEARVAIGAVSAVAMRVPDAEAALVGAAVDDASAVARAAAACRAVSAPIDDTRASANYRSAMIEVIARRAITATTTGSGE